MQWAELRPPKTHMLKSHPPKPQNGTLFEDGTFTEVITEVFNLITEIIKVK